MRLAWIALVNGFFFTIVAFGIWEDYVGIGAATAGFHNISSPATLVCVVLLSGVVLEALRSRVAGMVNVGLYAYVVLDITISALRSSHSESFAWIAVGLFAVIAFANLLLYCGILPLPFREYE